MQISKQVSSFKIKNSYVSRLFGKKIIQYFLFLFFLGGGTLLLRLYLQTDCMCGISIVLNKVSSSEANIQQNIYLCPNSMSSSLALSAFNVPTKSLLDRILIGTVNKIPFICGVCVHSYWLYMVLPTFIMFLRCVSDGYEIVLCYFLLNYLF